MFHINARVQIFSSSLFARAHYSSLKKFKFFSVNYFHTGETKTNQHTLLLEKRKKKLESKVKIITSHKESRRMRRAQNF